MSLFNVRSLDPETGADGDGIVIQGGAFTIGPVGGGATALVPLTTTVGGVPQLVWEADDSLALTEVPL